MAGNRWLLGAIVLNSMAYANPSILGKRYCEIIYSKDYMDFYVYSTASVNDCPQAWWKTLNHKIITKHLSASYVFLNGPRIWVANEMSNFNPGARVSINGAQLPQVASFHSSLQSLLKRHGPYVDYHVDRSQIYHFHPGATLYELKNPQGEVYVMSSFSLKHRTQSLSGLAQLGSQLHLPRGWEFKSGKISQAVTLTPNQGHIHVVMDELDNTYHKVTKDPLAL